MSIRLNGTSGHNLVTGAASVGIGTSNYTIAAWVKFMSDVNASAWVFGCFDSLSSAGLYAAWALGSTGTNLRAYGGSNGSDYEITLNTWYYCVLSYNGTVKRDRVFDDSASTTPLSDTTMGGDDLTGLNYFAVGDAVDFWACPDMEIACPRVHVGVAWSDAEARTESQKLTPQTGGGSIYGNWKLETTANDADGIQDSSGAGHHLTLTGGANGASRPDQLEALGGGGGSSSTRSPGKISVIGRTPMAIRPSISNRIVIS